MKYVISSLMALAVCCWAFGPSKAQAHVQAIDDSEGMSIQGGQIVTCYASYWSATSAPCGTYVYCPTVGAYVLCPNVPQSVSGNQVLGVVTSIITCYVCGSVTCGSVPYGISPPCTIIANPQ